MHTITDLRRKAKQSPTRPVQTSAAFAPVGTAGFASEVTLHIPHFHKAYEHWKTLRKTGVKSGFAAV